MISGALDLPVATAVIVALSLESFDPDFTPFPLFFFPVDDESVIAVYVYGIIQSDPIGIFDLPYSSFPLYRQTHVSLTLCL
jgi:hypothetical protein